jgi:hypothetical protein
MRYTTLNGEELALCERSKPNTGTEWLARMMWGPKATVWRKYRDGHETRETMPEFLAECVVATIPENEPDVARARIER